MELLHARDAEPRVLVADAPGQVLELRERVVQVVLTRLVLALLGLAEVVDVHGLLALGAQALLLEVRELRVLVQALLVVLRAERALRARRCLLLRHLRAERLDVGAHDA